MIRTNTAPWEIIITLIALTMLSVNNALSADQHVITDDGREVLLRQDGSWQFHSSDRFANTKEGQRVRLKADGSWQYVGNAPMTAEQQVRTTKLDIKLQKVVIETHEKKVQKNKRIKTQTVFYIDVELSPLAKNDITINKQDVFQVKVKDNNGKDYPVLLLRPAPAILKPNTHTSLIIRADGAPLWLDKVKSMEIVFNPGIFGIQDPITLSRPVTEFDYKKVKAFEDSK